MHNFIVKCFISDSEGQAVSNYLYEVYRLHKRDVSYYVKFVFHLLFLLLSEQIELPGQEIVKVKGEIYACRARLFGNNPDVAQEEKDTVLQLEVRMVVNKLGPSHLKVLLPPMPKPDAQQNNMTERSRMPNWLAGDGPYGPVVWTSGGFTLEILPMEN